MPSLVLRLGLGFAWGFLGLSGVGVRFSMVLSLCRVFVGAGVLSLGVCLSSVPLASSKYPHTWNGYHGRSFSICHCFHSLCTFVFVVP